MPDHGIDSVRRQFETEEVEPAPHEVRRRISLESQPSGPDEYDKYLVNDPEGQRWITRQTYSFGTAHVWKHCDPWVMAFVYAQFGAPFVLTGWKREVELWIDYHKDKAVYNLLQYFSDVLSGSYTSNIWKTTTKLKIYPPRSIPLGNRTPDRKFEVRNPDTGESLEFRQLPEDWIKPYNDLLDE